MKREKSAGAVIFRKDKGIKYLLLHYESGHWDFVRGNIEKEEDEKETVKREIKEETGISDVKFVNNFRETINYYYRKSKELIFKEVIFYLVGTRDKDVKLSYEHIGYSWLSFEKALKKLTFKTAKSVLEKANEFVVNYR